MSNFLEQYVEEARENVEELVNGLLRLEGESGDAIAHTVKELFRFAHNLKGMSAAMGLDGITETAHKMEDLLDTYRQSGGRPDPAQVDVLLAGADAVEHMIEEAATGANPPAPPELIGLLIAHRSSTEDDDAPVAAPGETVVAPETSGGEGWYEVELDENAQLRGARAAIVVRAAAERASLVDTVPDRRTIEAGKAASFRIRLTDVEDEAELVEQLGEIIDVVAVRPVAAPAPSAAGGNPRLEVRLSDDVQLPGARAAIVLRLVSERATVVSTNPDRQTIEAGKATVFVIEVGDDADVEQLKSEIGGMIDVASVQDVARPATAPTGGAGGASAGGGGGGDQRPGQRATVRVEVERLDDLMDLVSELVVGRGLLDEHASRLADRSLGEALATVHRTISDLQAMVAKVRMISLEKSFARLTRIVRDTARDVGKPVRFVTSGEDTELDRSMVDEVADPLMHLLRNSVDHGIEEPEARRASGKPEQGEVALRAYPEGNQVVIEVSDDGGGIDVDRVVAKAVSNGVLGEDEASQLSPEERLDLIFAPGLSTRDAASKISGRGVGMDVVRTAVNKLGGNVGVETQRGKGSLFTIRLPLSLAVAETLLVKICDETWAIPIDQVEETLRVSDEDRRSVRGQPVIDLRGEVVSLVHGRQRMYDEPAVDGSQPAVVFRHKGRRIALTVDELVGRSEVVVKPLPSDLTDIELASAVTILGDGSVGLILDVAAVVDPHRHRSSIV